MKKKAVPSGNVFSRLAELYSRMEQAYAQSAQAAGLSCAGCPTNCCTSYFQHHTRIEWIYLLKGIRALPAARQATLHQRASVYMAHAQEALAARQIPSAICPVNEDGLCTLYAHRLMICRMHGTRNSMQLPDGQEKIFAGCGQYVQRCGKNGSTPPALDRTPFYRNLAALEMELLKNSGQPLPRVNLTIAEMILAGPPPLR